MVNINSTIVILFAFIVFTHAGVIKQLENVFETTTVSMDDAATTMEADVTTIKNDSFNNNANETKEEDLGALTKDEEATILIIDQTLLDPAPAESIKAEKARAQDEKLGKLLLLSTPKIAEKPKQPEENLDESEETDETIENVTEITIETTTIVEPIEEITNRIAESANEQKTPESVKMLDNKTDDEFNQATSSFLMDVTTPAQKITKLYPINDTLYEDKINSQTEISKSSDAIVIDPAKVNTSPNFGSIILKETEVDNVLFDAESLEGSYTDIDSELHLQPIVQSVEIVPSSLDDTLLINYVQSW